MSAGHYKVPPTPLRPSGRTSPESLPVSVPLSEHHSRQLLSPGEHAYSAVMTSL